MRRLLIVTAALLALGLTAIAVGGAVSSADDGDGPFGNFLARVAEKLGITEAELKTAIQDAQLETIDEAVAEGRLTDERAARLRERVEEGGHLFARRPHHHPVPRLIVSSAVQVLGIETTDLVAELKAGKSLAEVAEAQGMPVEDFTPALLTEIQTQLDALVAEGKLTADRAAEMFQHIEENIDRIVNAHHEPGHHHGWRHAHDDRSPTTTETSITL
jgi:polyhydroxyalkanoate synthesis regulator phasin